MFNTVQGFSVTNRILLYLNVLLAPAQYASGLNNNCPSNIGFLAYNYYTQIQWYMYTRHAEMHALCLVIPHFTLMYTISYIGGISAGNIFSGMALGLGTAGVMILNLMASWTSYQKQMPMGYGVYEFFFFGWRTLSPGWRKLFLAWSIFDTLGMAVALGCMVFFAIRTSLIDHDTPWYQRYISVPVGMVGMLLVTWPLILWTELIIKRNHIESQNDWVAIGLFIAQVGTMLVPDFGLFNRETWRFQRPPTVPFRRRMDIETPQPVQENGTLAVPAAIKAGTTVELKSIDPRTTSEDGSGSSAASRVETEAQSSPSKL